MGLSPMSMVFLPMTERENDVQRSGASTRVWHAEQWTGSLLMNKSMFFLVRNAVLSFLETEEKPADGPGQPRQNISS